MRNHLWRRPFPTRFLLRDQPPISLEHMGPVACALLVEQFRFRLPIEPAIVERPVGETDKTVFGRAAAREQRIADCSGIKPRRGLHHARIAARDLFMAHICIEVIGDPRLEPVQIDVNEKSVPARLDARKRDREQIGQRRPVKPALAHRCLHERQAERQDRLDAFVKRTRCLLRRGHQFCALGLSPQMAKTDLPGRSMVGFAHKCRDGGSDLDTDRIARRRENAGVRCAVGRNFSCLVLVAIQIVDPDRVERFKVTLPHPREGQPVEP